MDEKQLDEQELIEGLLIGSEKALQVFYKEYGTKLRKYIYTKIDSSEDVEEVLQDVLLSALDSLVLFSGRSKLLTWLYSITRHEIADFYRRRSLKSIVFSRIPKLERFVSRALEPDAVLMRMEYERGVKKALDRLLPHYKEVLELKYMDGLSVREIAGKLSLTNKACESVLTRARQAFIIAYEREV
jgi:RNA polymerase sigma-70 factor (ECF subfamily)